MTIESIESGLLKTQEKLNGWIEQGIQMLPNLVVAILVVAVFWLASRWVQMGSKHLICRAGMSKSLENLLSSISRILVILLGVILALTVLDLQGAVFSLLAGVGVVGFALGFAFQDLAANFISGVILALRAPFKVGDTVDINGTQGTVIELRLRDTLIRNFDGQDIFVPNKEFMANRFMNFNSSGIRKIKIDVGIDYMDDPKRAVQIVEETLKKVDGIVEDPAPVAFVEGLGDSSVNLFGCVWIKIPGGDFLKVRNDATIAIKKALESEGLNIPFPVRTLELGSSAESLAKTLNR